MKKSLVRVLFLLGVLALLGSCKKEPLLIDNNQYPGGNYVSSDQIKNYINRIYIDLLGREPLPDEMESDYALLLSTKLDTATRREIIVRLQSDSAYLEGDSSYRKAYYNHFYDLVKVRMLEGVENDYFLEERGIYQNSLNAAISAGDSANAAKWRNEIQEINDVLNIKYDYETGNIGIEEIYFRLINNFVYDVINMNTFNFVNATFDNMYYRFPTTVEFQSGFEMIENNEARSLLGSSGSNRGDYMYIVTHSTEFYEGIVRWVYKISLLRDPNAHELSDESQLFYKDKNFQQLQQRVMITNEYANFD